MPPGLQHGFGEQAEGSVDGLVPLSGLEPMKVLVNRRARRAVAKAATAAVQPAASGLAADARVVEFCRVRSLYGVLVAAKQEAAVKRQAAVAEWRAAAADERAAELVLAAAEEECVASALEVAELEAELVAELGAADSSTGS